MIFPLWHLHWVGLDLVIVLLSVVLSVTIISNDFLLFFFSRCRTEMKMAALTHFRLLFLVFVCRKKPVNSEPAADAKQGKTPNGKLFLLFCVNSNFNRLTNGLVR